MGDNRIHIHDEVENEGYAPSPLMLLYHINLGYPLLSEDTVLETNCTDLWAESDGAIAGMDRATAFEAPTPAYEEQVFFRKAPASATARVTNPQLGMSVSLAFSGDQLPYFTEWKQMGEQDYVLGVEPGTFIPLGRKTARERGELLTITPGERKRFDVVIGVE